MYIGILTCDLQQGHGWGRYTVNLIAALRACGAQVTAVASRNSPTTFDFPVYPILPTVTPAEALTLPKLALQAARTRHLLAECDIIHAAIEPFAPLGAWIAVKRPFFITGHGTYVALPKIRRAPVSTIYQHAFLRADATICNGYYTESRLRAAVPSAKSRVVLLGIDAAKHLDQLAQAEPMPKSGPMVLFLPAIKPRKGTLELVRAMAIVRREIPNVRCVIVGRTDSNPEYTRQVMAEIDALGLKEVIHLTGFVADPVKLARWYKTADVFALPSLNHGQQFEGFGLVHLEAGLAGVPVIGTRDCGAQDAIDDGVTGLLVSQQNIAEELPTAIISLLRDPEKRQRMGAAGREKAMHQTWDRVAAQMMKIYEEAVHLVN